MLGLWSKFKNWIGKLVRSYLKIDSKMMGLRIGSNTLNWFSSLNGICLSLIGFWSINKDASGQWLDRERWAGTLGCRREEETQDHHGEVGLGSRGGSGQMKDIRPAGDKSNQPCEISGKWPLATSLIGPWVAGKGSAVPSLWGSWDILKIS